MEKTKELLKGLFTIVKKENGEEVTCFADGYIYPTSDTDNASQYPYDDREKIYKVVSDAMQKIGFFVCP